MQVKKVQHIMAVNLVCLLRYILEYDTTPLQMYLITLHTTLRKKRSLHRFLHSGPFFGCSRGNIVMWALIFPFFMLIAPIHLEASEQQPVGGCAAVEAHQDHLCAHQAARMLFPLTINNRLETPKMIMISCPNKKLKLFFHQKNIQCCRTLEMKK